jgi:hypothetical protein
MGGRGGRGAASGVMSSPGTSPTATREPRMEPDPTADFTNIVRAADRETTESTPADVSDLTERLKALEEAGEPDEVNQPVIDQLLRQKMATALIGLADRVAKEGTNGNYSADGVVVKAGQIEVRIQLDDFTDEVLAKLKELGFQESSRVEIFQLLIGTIDVEQLEALALLPEVQRINPST